MYEDSIKKTPNTVWKGMGKEGAREIQWRG
jgi:hypothetical protein